MVHNAGHTDWRTASRIEITSKQKRVNYNISILVGQQTNVLELDEHVTGSKPRRGRRISNA
jgi:hypothetical protein